MRVRQKQARLEGWGGMVGGETSWGTSCHSALPSPQILHTLLSYFLPSLFWLYFPSRIRLLLSGTFLQITQSSTAGENGWHFLKLVTAARMSTSPTVPPPPAAGWPVSSTLASGATWPVWFGLMPLSMSGSVPPCLYWLPLSLQATQGFGYIRPKDFYRIKTSNIAEFFLSVFFFSKLEGEKSPLAYSKNQDAWAGRSHLWIYQTHSLQLCYIMRCI